MINVTKSELPDIKDYIKYLRKIWITHWLTNNGEFVQLLTSRLKIYLDAKYISLVTNGTLAMQLAIKALDLQGEIITTPFTFAATTNVIIWEGCQPVFADIDPDTFNINPEDVEKKITDKTSAILAVHVYGNPCNVEKLQQIAEKHKLKLIYDAAHAFGVEHKDQSLFNYGDISTLSFHATKVFNTIEGGAVITKNKDLLNKINLLKDFGILTEEKVVLPGINAKMNEFQAVMGLCNLKDIERKIKLRKKIYDRYKEALSKFATIKFQKLTASKYNYAYMPVCFKDRKTREKVYSRLVKFDIKPRKYFFPLTIDSDFFDKSNIYLSSRKKLINARDITNRVLCLPLYSSLGKSSVDRIIDIIKQEL